MADEIKHQNNDQENSADKSNHQFRMRHDWNNLIEDIIQEGQKDGIFDNLKGKGKPLNLNKSLFGQELELAHGLMKESDLTPLWISNRITIKEKIETLRTEMKRVWNRHEREFRVIQDAVHRSRLTLSWDDAIQRWLNKVVEINKEIDSYNLKRPIDNLELIKLNLDKELERLDAPRWLR
jgi:DnaJ homolog subfamily C member 28